MKHFIIYLLILQRTTLSLPSCITIFPFPLTLTIAALHFPYSTFITFTLDWTVIITLPPLFHSVCLFFTHCNHSQLPFLFLMCYFLTCFSLTPHKNLFPYPLLIVHYSLILPLLSRLIYFSLLHIFPFL